MKTKIIPILLAVSLGFNIFFALASFQTRKRMQLAHSFHGRTEILAKQLGLDDDQYKTFQQLRDQYSQLRQSRGTKRKALFEELIKDQPSQKVLESLYTVDDLKQRQTQILNLMQRFMHILRAEQKQKFVEIMNKRYATSRTTKATEN